MRQADLGCFPLRTRNDALPRGLLTGSWRFGSTGYVSIPKCVWRFGAAYQVQRNALADRQGNSLPGTFRWCPARWPRTDKGPFASAKFIVGTVRRSPTWWLRTVKVAFASLNLLLESPAFSLEIRKYLCAIHWRYCTPARPPTPSPRHRKPKRLPVIPHRLPRAVARRGQRRAPLTRQSRY